MRLRSGCKWWRRLAERRRARPARPAAPGRPRRPGAGARPRARGAARRRAPPTGPRTRAAAAGRRAVDCWTRPGGRPQYAGARPTGTVGLRALPGCRRPGSARQRVLTVRAGLGLQSAAGAAAGRRMQARGPRGRGPGATRTRGFHQSAGLRQRHAMTYTRPVHHGMLATSSVGSNRWLTAPVAALSRQSACGPRPKPGRLRSANHQESRSRRMRCRLWLAS